MFRPLLRSLLRRMALAPLLAAPLLLLAACAARPETCTLAPGTALPLAAPGTLPIIEADINGRPARLLVDTGSDATVLSDALATRAGITATPTGETMRGAGGDFPTRAGLAARFALGPLVIPNQRVLLAPSFGPTLDGIVGLDVLVDFELDLDLPHHRLTLYPARRCSSLRPPWPSPPVALAVQQVSGSGHLYIPVQLDGQPLRGLLDSGASISTLSFQTAQDLGISRRRLETLPRGRSITVNPGGVRAYLAPFHRLVVADETIDNPVLTIADLPPFAGDLLVGEDYLRRRRFWIAVALGRIFVEQRSTLP